MRSRLLRRDVHEFLSAPRTVAAKQGKEFGFGMHHMQFVYGVLKRVYALASSAIQTIRSESGETCYAGSPMLFACLGQVPGHYSANYPIGCCCSERSAGELMLNETRLRP